MDAILPGRRTVEVQEADCRERGQTAIVRDLTLQGSHVNVAEVYASVEPKTLRLAKRIHFETLSETVLPDNCDIAGICRIQSNLRTYQRHGLTMTNGIIDLPAAGSSLLVMAKYRRKEVTLPKGTVLGIADLYERDVLVPTGDGQVEPLEVMAVAKNPKESTPTSGSLFKDQAPSDIPPRDQKAFKALAEADLDHLPPLVAEEVLRMLNKHDVMWTGGA